MNLSDRILTYRTTPPSFQILSASAFMSVDVYEGIAHLVIRIISQRGIFVLSIRIKQRLNLNIKLKHLKSIKFFRMNKKIAGLGLLLIFMMLAHNYVLNQPQSLQKDLQLIHSVSVTEFNLLYSIPSLATLFILLPTGCLYGSYPNLTMMIGVTVLLFGQILCSFFGAEGKKGYFAVFVGGRVFESSGAQILYVIQGNLASSWMGNFAGLIYILPEIGEIINVFLTPFAASNWGIKPALFLGVAFCCISFISCSLLFLYLKKLEKKKKSSKNSVFQEIQVTSPKTKSSEQLINGGQTKFQTPISKERIQGQIAKSEENIEITGCNDEGKKIPKEQKSNKSLSSSEQPSSILKAGKIFWLTILSCTINQCLYFPFLDNANELIQARFSVPYEQTGYFLCLPFVAAILTTLSMSQLLKCFQRKNLIFCTSFLPFLSHLIIIVIPNVQKESFQLIGKISLALGFITLGTGIGSYYSVIFAAVGMTVPQKLKGMAYSVLGFAQTLALSLIPILSGLIIEQDQQNEQKGYRNSSIMFACLALASVLVGFIIKTQSPKMLMAFQSQ